MKPKQQQNWKFKLNLFFGWICNKQTNDKAMSYEKKTFGL